MPAHTKAALWVVAVVMLAGLWFVIRAEPPATAPPAGGGAAVISPTVTARPSPTLSLVPEDHAEDTDPPAPSGEAAQKDVENVAASFVTVLAEHKPGWKTAAKKLTIPQSRAKIDSIDEASIPELGTVTDTAMQGALSALSTTVQVRLSQSEPMLVEVSYRAGAWGVAAWGRG